MLQNYLRPPKTATAADIVIVMKTRKGTSHTLIRTPEAAKTTSYQNGII